MQAAFQTGAVTDDHQNLGFAGAYIVSGDFFFFRMGSQRVRTWQVYQTIFLISHGKGALSLSDGFAGPVTGVLPHSGKSVKNSTFPHIRVAGQGDGDGLFVQGLLFIIHK